MSIEWCLSLVSFDWVEVWSWFIRLLDEICMKLSWTSGAAQRSDQSGGYHHWPKLQQSLVGWRLVLTGATGPRPKVPISQGVESSRPWNRTLAGLTIITVTKVRCKSRLSKSRKLKELHKLRIKRMKYYQPRAKKTRAWERPSSKTQTTSKECHCQDDNFSNEEQGECITRTIKIHGGVIVKTESRLVLTWAPNVIILCHL